MKDYDINLFYSEDDDGYIADIPDLQSCSAFGETPGRSIAGSPKSQGDMAGSRSY
jgi:hypothetical protein